MQQKARGRVLFMTERQALQKGNCTLFEQTGARAPFIAKSPSVDAEDHARCLEEGAGVPPFPEAEPHGAFVGDDGA